MTMTRRKTGMSIAILLLILMTASSSAAVPLAQDDNFAVPAGTNSMLFQFYLQSEATSYPGGFVFAVEHRLREKVGVRAGASFYGSSLTTKVDETTSSSSDVDNRDLENDNYSLVVAALGVYHFIPQGTLQASFACGPTFEWFKESTNVTDDYLPGDYTYEADHSQSGWGLGGQAVLDIEWRLNQQVSLLGSYGYRVLYHATDSENTSRTSGNIHSINGSKGDQTGWRNGITGASLGLVFHF